MENTKSPWQSKTIILNSVLGLLAIIAVFIPGAESLKGWINGHGAEIGVGWSVLGILLRMITKDKVALGD